MLIFSRRVSRLPSQPERTLMRRIPRRGANTSCFSTRPSRPDPEWTPRESRIGHAFRAAGDACPATWPRPQGAGRAGGEQQALGLQGEQPRPGRAAQGRRAPRTLRIRVDQTAHPPTGTTSPSSAFKVSSFRRQFNVALSESTSAIAWSFPHSPHRTPAMRRFPLRRCSPGWGLSFQESA